MKRYTACVQLDRASEVFETLDEATDRLALVTPVEMLRAEDAVLDAVAKQMEACGEHGSSDGEDRLFGASPRLDAQKLGKLSSPRFIRRRRPNRSPPKLRYRQCKHLCCRAGAPANLLDPLTSAPK